MAASLEKVIYTYRGCEITIYPGSTTVTVCVEGPEIFLGGGKKHYLRKRTSGRLTFEVVVDAELHIDRILHLQDELRRVIYGDAYWRGYCDSGKE